jgi:putative ABC transport system permease protein
MLRVQWMLWKFSWRQMGRRPGRAALTLLGIVIGVATIVGVSLTTRAAHRAYHDMFESVTGRASLEIVAEGFGGFDETLPSLIASVPDVKLALPAIQLSAALVARSGPTPVLILGVDPERDEAIRDYYLHRGTMLGTRAAVLLERGFGEGQGIDLEDRVRLWTTSGLAELPVQGLLKAAGAAAFNGGAVAFMPLATAQRLFSLEGKINSVQIVLTDNADPGRIRGDILARLPTGLTVQAPRARGEQAQDALFSTEQALAGGSMTALVAGVFVILNTVHMNLGERRRQLAILRALGATRGQVTRLILRETLLLGLAGTVLGLGVGFGLAFVLTRGMEQLMGTALPEVRWTPAAIVLAAIVGPGTALAASWLPARRAGRRQVLEDLPPGAASRREISLPGIGYAGLALLALHLLLVWTIARGWLDASVIAPVMGVGIVGCVLALPLFMRPLMAFTRIVVVPLLGLEGRLALRHLQRHPRRTALTVGILAIAVFVGIGVGNALFADIHDLSQWVERVAVADFYIRGTIPDAAYAITLTALPESLATQLAGLEGAGCVDRVNWILTRAHDQRVAVLACTLPSDRPPPLDLVEGDPATVNARLRKGEVVLGTALARRLKLGLGDAIVVEGRHGPERLTVAGTTNEYTIDGMALYMEWTAARRLFAMEGVHVFAVTARPGMAAALGQELKKLSSAQGLILQSRADLRAYVDNAAAGITGLLWTLLTLVLLVSSLGIVNTLTINTLEQTRELGILRALGLKRAGLRKLVLAEALIIGTVSLLPGVSLGLLLAYQLNHLTNVVLAHPIAFTVNVPFAAGCVALTLGVAVMAGLLPARRAGRLHIAAALQYE